ncbi:MAG: phosphoribosylglycinamide formyltransferase [Candidatus Poseidoniia archaeon]|nr:phosphoribosylglycinamide formyltransferase [Candidatus Poseidoniia archaeon]
MNGVVLISGNGSNLQSIIDNAKSIDLNICCVVSNKMDAFGLKRAAKVGIPCVALDETLFDSKLGFDQEIMKVIDNYQAEVIILAGYMRILSADFISKYSGKILNIHPSLLPKFPGLNTHQRAIDASEKKHGASVHFVTEEVDGGPVIAQQSVNIDSTDNSQTLAKKVLKKEHVLYPQVIGWYTQGRLKLLNNKTVILDK